MYCNIYYKKKKEKKKERYNKKYVQIGLLIKSLFNFGSLIYIRVLLLSESVPKVLVALLKKRLQPKSKSIN